jgi:flavin reductase (DIM6/NTAB) family NADH-FMN oxidoreductase RutF
MSGTYPQVNISEQTFKEAMSLFPSGVTVIMTEGEEGHSVGMTASAFISVSLSPPLVLESVAKTAQMHAHLMREERYSVSILGAHQVAESNHFAGFGDSEFTPNIVSIDQLPAVGGSLARVACRTISRVDMGDHTLFIGQVQHVDLEDSDEPALIYARRDYHLHVPLSTSAHTSDDDSAELSAT